MNNEYLKVAETLGQFFNSQDNFTSEKNRNLSTNKHHTYMCPISNF